MIFTHAEYHTILKAASPDDLASPETRNEATRLLIQYMPVLMRPKPKPVVSRPLPPRFPTTVEELMLARARRSLQNRERGLKAAATRRANRAGKKELAS